MNFTPLEIAAAIIIFQFAVLIYLLVKDKNTQKKIRTIAKAVGEIDRSKYESEMRLNEKIKELQNQPQLGLNETEVEMLIDSTISSRLVPAEQALSMLQQEFLELQNSLNMQLGQLESTVKAASVPVSSMGSTDEKKIISLYEEGKDIESIARTLRISNAEVEFALKVANFR